MPLMPPRTLAGVLDTIHKCLIRNSVNRKDLHDTGYYCLVN